MLKFLCNPRTDFIELSFDNLRGEARWERNNIAALVSSGKSVHTVKRCFGRYIPMSDLWALSPYPMPSNFHNGYNPDWADESISITYGCNEHTKIEIPAKYYIVNYQDGPSKEFAYTFHKFNINGSAVAICNHPSWTYLKNLKRQLGDENVELVIGPFIPHTVNEADNFHKPYLFWSYRNFLPLYDREPNNVSKLLNQIFSYMDKDDTLKFAISLGSWNYNDYDLIRKNPKEWLLNLSCFKPYDKFFHRIHVFFDIHWYEMLHIFSQTKLIVSPPESLGYTPFEAAMFGIPTIVDEFNNPFQDSDRNVFFKELVTSSKINDSMINDEFLSKLDLLYRDYDTYHKSGIAYRLYAEKYATYDAYIRQLDRLIEKRGWK